MAVEFEMFTSEVEFLCGCNVCRGGWFFGHVTILRERGGIDGAIGQDTVFLLVEDVDGDFRRVFPCEYEIVVVPRLAW